MMSKPKLLVALVGLMVACVCLAGGQAPDAGVNKLMRQKLDHAQRVLSGLALEDFAEIRRSADALGQLSQAAAWRVLQTPQYQTYSADFLRLSERLSQAARDKNLDGATLAYVELTVNCVNCHKHVRAIRMAKLDDPAAPVAR